MGHSRRSEADEVGDCNRLLETRCINERQSEGRVQQETTSSQRAQQPGRNLRRKSSLLHCIHSIARPLIREVTEMILSAYGKVVPSSPAEQAASWHVPQQLPPLAARSACLPERTLQLCHHRPSLYDIGTCGSLAPSRAAVSCPARCRGAAHHGRAASNNPKPRPGCQFTIHQIQFTQFCGLFAHRPL